MNRRGVWIICCLTVLAIALVAGLIVATSLTNQERTTALNRLAAQRGKVNRAAPAVKIDARDAPSHRQSEAAPPNAYAGLIARYAQWRSEASAWSELDVEKAPYTWSEDTRRRLEQFIDAHQDWLAEIRRAAAEGATLPDVDPGQDREAQLRRLPILRDIGRLLRADALVQASRGNYQAAFDDIIAGMQFAAALVDQPGLGAQLIRVAVFETMNDAIAESFPPGVLNPDQTRQLINAAQQSNRRQAIADTLFTATDLGLDVFNEVREGQVPREAEEIAWGANVGAAIALVYGSPVARPLLNIDEAGFADTMAELADLAALPYYEARPHLEEIERQVDELPFTRVISHLIWDQYTLLPLAQARQEAMGDLLPIGLALEQYRAEQGRYPETLNAIAARLGGALPLDPFTGAPYRYSLAGDGFTLYSLGQNLIDDGGRPNPDTGDIVWRGQQAPGPEKTRLIVRAAL